MKGPATGVTRIAELEAGRNQAAVLAEGALLGERRAAIARIVMVALLGIVTNVGATAPGDSRQTIVGAVYTVFALVTCFVVFRAKPGNARHATWRPLGLTVVDFAFITTQAYLDLYRGEEFSPGQHVAASAILICFSVARLGWWHVVVSAGFATLSYLFVASLADQADTHTTVFVLAALWTLTFLLALTNRALGRLFRELRQRDNLTRFLPRQVAERILANGSSALAPVEREVTVLFSDIRGFTSMSEGLPPVEVLAMLDDYFGRMRQVVKGHDGVVGKFLGDGMLAFWGVPDRAPDHAASAVKAARDMQRVLVEMNRDREARRQAPLKVGIGIHTGPVAAGMLGGALQAEYTVIGDAVNVASRIEGLTKDHGVDILLSETTFAALPATVGAERLAAVTIRGRKEPITLYTVRT